MDDETDESLSFIRACNAIISRLALGAQRCMMKSERTSQMISDVVVKVARCWRQDTQNEFFKHTHTSCLGF